MLTRIVLWLRSMLRLPGRLEDLQMAVGRIERRQTAVLGHADLDLSEFKVFSQNGEDGIIQFLLRNVPIESKTFVEFGVHDYAESNTRFLLRNDNWSGLIIDASARNIALVRSEELFWRGTLHAECAFVDRENIDEIIRRNGIEGDIGVLSIDIDGNDYWVWEAISCISPRIVICEYNSLFGSTRKVTTAYDPRFVRHRAHFSGLYWGASIAAFNELAAQKGYALVGSNRMGNNLFFVRRDVVGPLKVRSPEEAYVKAQFRISRGRDGEFTFLGFDEAFAAISELPLEDLEKRCQIPVRDLRGPG
jgi:hypothetical protein